MGPWLLSATTHVRIEIYCPGCRSRPLAPRVVFAAIRREPMEDRRAVMRHRHFIRAVVCSLVLGFAHLAGGCGGEPGSETASSEKAKYAQGLKEQFQKRPAMQKGASGKRPGRSP
jgi:hypothetical protein